MNTKITLVLMFAIATLIGNAQTITNVARSKTVTPSYINPSYAASNVVDGDKTSASSRWLSNGTLPVTIDIDLGGTYTISSYAFYTTFAYPLKDFKFQYYNGSAYVDIDSQTGNTNISYSKSFTAITVNKVRLSISSMTGNADNVIRLFEVEVNGFAVTNVALNKTTNVSEVYTGGAYPGSKAVDGDISSSSSRWMTNGTLPGWIEVDLGGTYTINSYTFYAQATFPLKDFKFQYWNGTAYVDLDSQTGNTTDSYSKSFTPVTVNKVRLYVTSQPNGNMVRLYELQVFGFSATNIALNKTASASSYYDSPNHTANFAVDGDRTSSTSRWMSAGGYPQYIDIDLNGSYDINAMAFWNGAIGSGLTQFNFQYWNGTSWVDIISETGPTEYYAYNKTFTSVRTSKVRLNVTGATLNSSPIMRLYEIEVYGSKVISVVGNATAFTTTYGIPSTSQSFTVSGNSLSSALIATAPTGFEVSSDGTNYNSTATFSLTGGNASGTLNVRLKANAAVTGTYNSQNIVLSSTGVTSVNISTTVSGNTVTAKALTITAANQTVAYGTLAATVTGAGTYTPTGFVNSETASVISGSATYNTNYTNSTAAATSDITITPVVTGLSATNYSFTPVDGTITITAADVTVSSPNISVSDLVLSPVSNITVNTNGSLLIDQSKQIASVTVNAGAKLSVADGQTLTLTNLTLKSDADATSTYVPTGTNKTGTLTVTGTTTVEQYLATTRNWYVSSPVSNAVAPAGYTYYGRYEPGGTASGWTPVSVGADLVAGKGYIALPSAPKAGLPITFTTQTEGTLNNGTITIPLTYTSNVNSGKGYNLIGNPYPSHLSWTYEFTQANASKIESTIWYRTNSGGSNASGWSFVTFNPVTAETVPSTANGGIIPPMQAFWVLAKDVPSNSIQFTNDMRSHQTGNPLKAPAVKNTDRKKIRLQLSNGTTADEALIVFDTNASDNYDAYDSPKMMNNAADIADIYTVLDTKKLVINGLNSVTNNMILTLGYNAGVEGSLTLKVNELSNFDGNTRVYLVDGSTETELAQGVEYTFNTAKISGNESRFSLLFRAPGASTGFINAENGVAQVFVNVNNQIAIIAPAKSKYTIFNTVGMLIENSETTSNYQTLNRKLQTGVYVVRVNNELTKVIIK
jgi:hypothetical protein